MWARALFVQDDTLHIHSSTSRQTFTDLGSLPVWCEEKNEGETGSEEVMECGQLHVLGCYFNFCLSGAAGPANCRHKNK